MPAAVFGSSITDRLPAPTPRLSECTLPVSRTIDVLYLSILSPVVLARRTRSQFPTKPIDQGHGKQIVC